MFEATRQFWKLSYVECKYAMIINMKKKLSNRIYIIFTENVIYIYYFLLFSSLALLRLKTRHSTNT